MQCQLANHRIPLTLMMKFNCKLSICVAVYLKLFPIIWADSGSGGQGVVQVVEGLGCQIASKVFWIVRKGK